MSLKRLKYVFIIVVISCVRKIYRTLTKIKMHMIEVRYLRMNVGLEFHLTENGRGRAEMDTWNSGSGN